MKISPIVEMTTACGHAERVSESHQKGLIVN